MRFNAIGNGRFSALLTRTFWIKSGEAAAPTLADEITPVVEVNNQSDPAMAYLRNERLAGGWNVIVPNATEYGYVRLVNPFGSGVLAIIDRIQIAASAAGNLFWVVNNGYAGTTISGKSASFRDVRWYNGTAQPVCGVAGYSSVLDPAGYGALWQFDRLIASNYDDPIVIVNPGIVLPPGTTCEVGHGTASLANPGIEGAFLWRERPVAAEELSTG